jgi:tripartite ATP-independent transporter DctM subunit
MSTVLSTRARSAIRAAGLPSRLGDGARRLENGTAAAAFLAMGALPVIELTLRTLFAVGIPGSAIYIANLTLWVGFLGAMIASREQRHLTLAAGLGGIFTRLIFDARLVCTAVSAAAAAGLLWSSVQFVRSAFAAPAYIDEWLPDWIIFSILPLAFAVMTARFAAGGGRSQLLAGLIGITFAAGFGFLGGAWASSLLGPGLALLLIGAVLGTPIFITLGGAALLLFFAAGVPVGSIMAEAYRIVISPALATIPLFTLTGYILAEGRTTDRLVRLFGACFGWLPGGLAMAAVLVCAFFSTFTGASGVTILALGGLLLPVLLRDGYPERFSIGLLTATGSIGLLFPPSLAVIIYGVVARVSILDLFVAAVIPGLAMVAAVCVAGTRVGLAAAVQRRRFDPAEAAAALWDARWEALLPVIAVAGIFGGYCTLAEAAAITVVYALLVQTAIYRDLSLIRDVPRILVKCAALIGGVFAILGAATGLTSYLVDADIPSAAVSWVQQFIQSPAMFLLVLNLLLLAVGCVMDIFSAIAVVLPLIIPLGAAYGIHPLHLAMIFLTNLELGFLTPPVGLNLFLASYRFERPLADVTRSALPFLLLLGLVVLAVTYAPLLGLVPAWTVR